MSVCRWYVFDGLGSVVGEVDPSGNLTSSPKYDVYGLVRQNPGTASSAMGFVGGLGHLSEAGTGLIYMKARYYDPVLGRFESEDTAHDGENWFVYCADNPVNYIDANGKDAEKTWIAIGCVIAFIGAFLLLVLSIAPLATFSTVLAVGAVSAELGIAVWTAIDAIIAGTAVLAALGNALACVGTGIAMIAAILDASKSEGEDKTPSEPTETPPSDGSVKYV